MNIITNGAYGCSASAIPATAISGTAIPATAIPAPTFLGAHAWRVRQMTGAESVLSLLVADVPVAKPNAVSALPFLERCP